MAKKITPSNGNVFEDLGFPKPLLERYHLAEGDTVHLIETEEGILITPFDPDFQKAMEIYAEGAKRYRNAMRELAK